MPTAGQHETAELAAYVQPPAWLPTRDSTVDTLFDHIHVLNASIHPATKMEIVQRYFKKLLKFFCPWIHRIVHRQFHSSNRLFQLIVVTNRAFCVDVHFSEH